MRILSIALIGRQNQPLFIKSYGRPTATVEEDLKWHFVAHTSLDVFEEREASNFRQNDHYAGLLQVMDDYAVYGYQTSTRVKIVLVLALTEETVKDNDIKTIFKAIHNAYVAYLSNPFNESCGEGPDFVAPPIHSKKFEDKLKNIAMAQGAELQRT
ncbi:Sedlin [Cystobasidium minutum MCA 4210]|uniref:Sedlin n=1 Tax=Cystobasidium minutum MCA 4210 TaxID=1397322 RepID=UPI0034CE280F|eukprot:jgi/Rhomi1/196396/gm1.4610_g